MAPGRKKEGGGQSAIAGCHKGKLLTKCPFTVGVSPKNEAQFTKQ